MFGLAHRRRRPKPARVPAGLLPSHAPNPSDRMKKYLHPLKRLLAAKGVHYLVTRFGGVTLRRLAFDGKYESGEWKFQGDGTGDLPAVLTDYLCQGDLLMMGCGGASILDGLPPGSLHSATGIDISPEAIRAASRRSSAQVSFHVAEMESFEPPRLYDVILFSESLYYVPAAGQLPLLRRLAQSLKPHGVFVVTLAEARRYRSILEAIRSHLKVLEDRTFSGSSRHVIVFAPP